MDKTIIIAKKPTQKITDDGLVAKWADDLRNTGLKVFIAENPEETEEQLKNNNIDALIFIDHASHLPGYKKIIGKFNSVKVLRVVGTQNILGKMSKKFTTQMITDYI